MRVWKKVKLNIFLHRCNRGRVITFYTDYKITPMIRWKKDNWFVMPGIENGRQVGIVFGLEISIGD